MATHPNNSAENAISSNITVSCLYEFRVCLEHTQNRDKIRMQTRQADFKLWIDSVGATANGEASLDWRYRNRPKDIRFIQGLLYMLKALLQDCSKAAKAGAVLSDVIANIDSTIDSLAFIGVQARRGGRKSRLQRADGCYATNKEMYRDLRAHLSCIITARPTTLERPKDEGAAIHSVDYFSSADLTTIQERLVEANLRRRHRFIEAQRHSEGLKGPATSNMPAEITPGSLAIAAVDTKDESNPVPDQQTSISTSTMREREVPRTFASSLESNFAGLAISRKTGTTATRITNITAGARYPEARYPADADQKLVQCPCCCQAIPVVDLEDSHWR